MASAVRDEGWTKGMYENGWNARQLVCHIAAMSGTVGFVLGMARMPSPPILGTGFDEDAFNAPQVAREGRTTEELVGEIKGNFEREIGAVHSALDDLLAKNWKTPWGSQGEGN